VLWDFRSGVGEVEWRRLIGDDQVVWEELVAPPFVRFAFIFLKPLSLVSFISISAWALLKNLLERSMLYISFLKALKEIYK